ncbi:MAG: cyclopropane fatty acyl phospholipid synthase [Steroidobacteraceae bacterium]
MASENARRLVTEIAALAGVAIDGNGPCDIRVLDSRFYDRVARDGSLGLGESYMEGWWDVGDLAGLHERIACARLGDRHESGRLALGLRVLRARLFNLQSRSRAPIVAEEHYDLTDRAYRCMTDSWHTLSCGYWREARDLQSAQEAKLDLVCRKLGIREGDHVLDVGCGMGSFARYAATHYGCRVTGINVSKRQVEIATELARGLPVEFVLCDYRDLPSRFGPGHFDHAASMGMFEHVGHRNIPLYMKAVRSVLSDDGLFLLHTVGSDVTVHHNDPWFDRYIFPNGMLPSVAQIGRGAEGSYTIEDWHNFGYDYSLTCQAWFEQFDRNWPEPKDTAFYRMWKYYLLCSAGQFSARRLQLWQVVLAARGVPGGYATVR